MITDDLGKQLHDKATRGIKLSDSEIIQLEAWYAMQDKAESEQLMFSSTRSLISVQDQVEAAIHQLQSVTQRIQELTMQNDAIRQEIVHLQGQLSYLQTSQAA